MYTPEDWTGQVIFGILCARYKKTVLNEVGFIVLIPIFFSVSINIFYSTLNGVSLAIKRRRKQH